MKRRLRAVRIFLVWVVLFFLQGMLYTAHRGFDFPEIMVLAPIFAAIATVFWLRKISKMSHYPRVVQKQSKAEYAKLQ
jgi:hypothetical protein